MLIALTVLLVVGGGTLLVWWVGRDRSPRDPDPEGTFRREHGLTPLQMEAVRQARGRFRPPEDPVVRRAVVELLRAELAAPDGWRLRDLRHLVISLGTAVSFGALMVVVFLLQGRAAPADGLVVGATYAGMGIVMIWLMPLIVRTRARWDLRRAESHLAARQDSDPAG
ncbi:hypothetical protein GB931_17120 [Modestobacter sp. I12A-02628]|uniref:Uncharacterized protein n=1 Tax=Goekera deserti TaxID=2497753 RepID=A0A7K3WE34_9ACTN|nr:hypothetical protein [Goekera deserti]MPQ99606.1 hypothetical protein [Goekera deserti]NDI46384.1 hypothetical protein [Goekera deserti]NEL54684.1 hypothetical protein [Goekera deserti]